MANTNKIYIGGPNTQPKNIYIQSDKVKQIYKGNDLLYSMSEEYTNKIRFNIYKKGSWSSDPYQKVNDIYFSYSTDYTSTTPSDKLYSKYTQQDVPIDNLLGQDKMDGKTSYYYYIHPYDPKYYKNTSYSYINTLDLSNLDINKFFAYSKGLTINDLSRSNKYYCYLIFDGCDFSKIGYIYINSYTGIYKYNHPYGVYASGAKFKNSSYLKDLLGKFRSNRDAWSTDEPYNNYFRSLDIRNVRFESEPKTLNSYALFLGQNMASTIDFSNDIIKGNTSMKLMFGGCRLLTSLDVSKWDVSSVTDMNYMFYDCKNLTSLDVSKWDVSSVTDMNGMFNNCKSLTSLDVSKWDVSNVTNMINMFVFYEYRDIKHNLTSLDVSNWNVSNVTNMINMFYGMNSLTALDLTKWNVSNVTDISSIFEGCSELKTLIAGHESETKVTALNGLKVDIDLSDCTKLNDESIMAICRGLASLPSDNKKTITLPNKVKDDALMKLNVELTLEVKNWTIAYK